MPFSLFFCTDSLGYTSCVSNTPCPGGRFLLNRRGKLRSAERGRLPRPRLGQKGRDTCGFPSSLNSYLSLISYPDANQRPATASKNRNGSRVTTACLSPPFRSSQIAYCYTGGLINARRGMTVPRKFLARCNARHLRIKRLVQFIFVGPVYNNALKDRAALLCRACGELPVCVAVMYLTLRIC